MTITTADLTEATLSGGGVFDELMKANKAHLDEEYGKNRIRGPEYSQVYLGAMQSAMQYSIQFLLEKDRAAAQAALIEEQANTERKQQELLDTQISKAAKEEELIDQQILSATEEVTLVQARVSLTEEQSKSEAKQNEPDGILDTQKAQIEAQTALTSSQEAQVAAETDNVPKQGALLDAQAEQVSAEAALSTRRLDQVDEEILLSKEQVLLAKEELKINTAKLANIPFEGDLLQAQTASTEAEALRVKAQTDLLDEQVNEATKRNALDGHVDQELKQLKAQTIQTENQAANLAAELENISKEGNRILAEVDRITTQSDLINQQSMSEIKRNELGGLLDAEIEQTTAQTDLLGQQKTNAVTQNTVLVAEECKLRADFDYLQEQKLKAAAESALLAQKKVTEAAQTVNNNVDPDSIIGRQKLLYKGQTEGYARDAEQKAAKLMVDSWNIRRTTDEGTEANVTNKLDDGSVGRAVSKVLTGVNA